MNLQAIILIFCYCLINPLVSSNAHIQLKKFYNDTTELPNPNISHQNDNYFNNQSSSNLSFTNSSNFTYKGSAHWSGIRDIEIQGNYAYCAITNGLMILDISNPLSPFIVSKTYLENGYTTAISLFDSLIYITSWGGSQGGEWHGTLHILDISNIDNPKILSKFFTGPDAYSIIALHEWVYVGTRGRLLAIDVSDSENPVLVDQVNLGSDETALSLSILGDYLFMADGDVKVFNISDRSNLEKITEIITPRFAIDLSISQNIMAIADNDLFWPEYMSSLQLVNISDPSNPILGNSIDISKAAGKICTDDNFAYIGGNQGITIIEIINVDSLVKSGFYSAPGVISGLDIKGNLLFTTSFKNTYTDFSLYDCDSCNCANMINPEVIHRGDLQIIDVADRSTPCTYSYLPDNKYVTTVAINGANVYLTDWQTDSSLSIVNAKSLDTLSDVSSININGNGYDLCVSNDLLYVAAGKSGVQIFDLFDPDNPLLISTLSLPGKAFSVTEVDQKLYVASFDAGIFIINVSDPNNPEVIGQYDTPYFALDVAVENNFAYVADREGGLIILDVTDVQQPIFVGHHPSSVSTGFVEVHNNSTFINDGEFLLLLDVTNPQFPQELSSIHIGTWFNDFAVQWDAMKVIASNGWDGLVCIDATDPINLQYTGIYDSPGFSSCVRISNNFIWIADNWSIIRLELPIATDIGDGLYPINLPSKIKIAGIYPNPFNLEATILIELPYKGDISIDIYNILGEKIKNIYSGSCSGGKHKFAWFGQNENGLTVSSGIYFTKLRFNNESSNYKMLLLK